MSALRRPRRVAALLFGLAVAGACAARGQGPRPPEPTQAQKAGAYILLKVENGIKSYEKGDNKQAVAELSEALRLQPGNAKALLYRGKAHRGLKDWDRSIADFSDLIKAADLTRALEIDPKGPDSYDSYLISGVIRRQKKDFTGALAAYDRAITLDPKRPRGYLDRGALSYAEGDHERAIRDYSTAIELRPREASSFSSRAACYYALRKFDLAVADYTAAIDLDPKNADFYQSRGWAHYDRKAYDETIADATRAIQLNAKDAWSWALRGNAYRCVKAYERALANYAEAIKLSPDDPTGYNLSAWLYATCPDARYRDGKKALEHAAKARELMGGKPDGDLEPLAAAYAENGRFDEAVRWQKKAVEMLKEDDPARAEARSRLKLYEEKKPFRE
jgi:tetratricopeptide (TPR) repeat protein